MEHLSEAKARLDAMRPLSNEQIERLWPMWVKEDALYVYTSNAIEGNTLALGETTVVLEDGVTIGGKTVREHLEVINGAKAYALMLDMAKDKRSKRTCGMSLKSMRWSPARNCTSPSLTSTRSSTAMAERPAS